MALDDLRQNMLSDIMAEGEIVRAQRDRLVLLLARWRLNDGWSVFGNSDIAEIRSIAHLDKERISEALDGYQSIVELLGDYENGLITKFVRLKG